MFWVVIIFAVLAWSCAMCSQDSVYFSALVLSDASGAGVRDIRVRISYIVILLLYRDNIVISWYYRDIFGQIALLFLWQQKYIQLKTFFFQAIGILLLEYCCIDRMKKLNINIFCVHISIIVHYRVHIAWILKEDISHGCSGVPPPLSLRIHRQSISNTFLHSPYHSRTPFYSLRPMISEIRNHFCEPMAML